MRHRLMASICVPLILGWASSAAAQSLVIYPAKGQSAVQQSKDEEACRGWARQNTGVDPLALANSAVAAPATASPPQSSAPPPSGRRGGERIRGAGRGAAVGAAVGAVAGDAGKGAAVGAIAGTAAGGARKRHAEQEAQRAEAEAQQAARASAEAASADAAQKLATFNRAYSACLEGRGYTVK